MTTPAANANGHRRRQLRKRVLAEETHCAIGGELVDKTLTILRGAHGPRCKGNNCPGCIPHPQRAEVDEDTPRSRGGSPYDRANTRLVCREHNQIKGAMTLAEIKAKLNADTLRTPTRTITTLVNW